MKKYEVAYHNYAEEKRSRSGFRWPFSKLNKLKAVITFHDSEILQSHSMVFLPSTETKLLSK